MFFEFSMEIVCPGSCQLRLAVFCHLLCRQANHLRKSKPILWQNKSQAKPLTWPRAAAIANGQKSLRKKTQNLLKSAKKHALKIFQHFFAPGGGRPGGGHANWQSPTGNWELGTGYWLLPLLIMRLSVHFWLLPGVHCGNYTPAATHLDCFPCAIIEHRIH